MFGWDVELCGELLYLRDRVGLRRIWRQARRDRHLSQAVQAADRRRTQTFGKFDDAIERDRSTVRGRDTKLRQVAPVTTILLVCLHYHVVLLRTFAECRDDLTGRENVQCL